MNLSERPHKLHLHFHRSIDSSITTSAKLRTESNHLHLTQCRLVDCIMALVTITGYPCSGKSRIARLLADDFELRLKIPEYNGPALEVVVVDDESSHVPRSVYDGQSLFIVQL